MPADVDFRIMLTFLEFYRELLGFVNYKLLHDLTLAQEANATMDDFSALDKNGEATAALTGPASEKEMEAMTKAKTLFQNNCFHISREVPTVHFSFICTAFSGHISTSPQDPKVTHIIADRPLQPEQMVAGKIYVQPQWVVDCVNQRKILPHAPYGIGKICPPHLSPFVVYDHATYQPPEAMGSTSLSANVEEEQEDVSDEEEEEENQDEEAEEEEVEETVVTSGERYQDKEEDEAAATAERKKLAQAMMSKKDLKLYKKMQHSNRRKDQEVDHSFLIPFDATSAQAATGQQIETSKRSDR